jgi:hypothetical protein
MTEMQAGQASADAQDDRLELDPDVPGFGWLFFAGTVLGFAGVMRVIDAIWAFGYNASLPEGLEDGILGSNLKTYAWTWLAVGIILIAASVFVLVRSQFARWIGFIAAAIGGISAMTWMPYYPVWSVTYIGLAVLVFYALARHGGRTPA